MFGGLLLQGGRRKPPLANDQLAVLRANRAARPVEIKQRDAGVRLDLGVIAAGDQRFAGGRRESRGFPR
jgi:hypothetical protein